MKCILSIYLCFLSIFSWSQNDDLKFEIERIILNDTGISLDETPGFIIAIIDGYFTYVVDFGADSLASDSTLLVSDIFELGSMTKVMTASLVSVLVDEGEIAYDEPVNSYLPIEKQNPRLDSVTILDLVQHYSSLPFRPLFFGRKNIDTSDPYRFYTKDDLLDFYRQYVTSKEEKDVFRYAHTNYALLEIVLEHALDKEYGQLMREYLFDPLGMTSSFINFREERENVLTPGFDRAQRVAKPWTFTSFAASEGAKSTMTDMIAYMRANIGISNTRYDSIFSYNITPQKPTDFNEVIYTGRGWQILNRKKRYDIITHTGKTGGHNIFAAFIKETKTGVVVLANSSVGTENLGFLVLRMINRNWKRKS